MMSKKSKQALREEYGLTSSHLSKEEMQVLHQKDVLEAKLVKTPRADIDRSQDDRMMVGTANKANFNGDVIIDKVCMLSFPLNDPRTPESLRKEYLKQEDLMLSKFLNNPMSEWDQA
jgi:hypothetical protein